MSLSNKLWVVSPEVIKGITIHSPCCHTWVSHLWDVAISRIPVFCVKWTLSADQPYQANCTIAVQSQTWWPVWDPQLEDELCGPMGLLDVMAARASKGQPELHTRTQRLKEKSCTCSFLSLQSTFAAPHVSLYRHSFISLGTNGNSERRGYLSKIMADVWPSWVFQAQSFPLQKCLLLHTPAIPLIGIVNLEVDLEVWIDLHTIWSRTLERKCTGEEVERLNRRRIWKALNIVIKNLGFIQYTIRNNDV